MKIIDLTDEAYRTLQMLKDGNSWGHVQSRQSEWVSMQGIENREDKEDIFGSSCTEYEKIVGPNKEALVKITRHYQQGLGNEQDSTRIQFLKISNATRIYHYWETDDPIGLKLALVTDSEQKP